tara:strand:+ start:22663 stop:23841 length:1179 start_codon:yes stop_codon:yes gene_type:complete
MTYSPDFSPLERSSSQIGRTLSGLGGLIGNKIQQSQQEQQQAQMNEVINAALQGDAAALEMVGRQNPELGMKIQDRLAAQAKEEAELFQSDQAKIMADVMERIELAPPNQQEALFQKYLNDDRFDIDEDDRNYFMNPDARKAMIGKIKGKEYAESFFGGGGDADLPAESVGFNDLIKDFTPEQKKLAKQVKAGLKGRAVSNAELSAIQSGEIDNYGKWKVQQKQAEKFAELSGSSRAKAIDAGIDKIAKIDVGLSNIDAAIDAVNAGAGTGAIEKRFPSLKAASVALDNIQGRMALDVVGAVTFGALSEGELNLAREVALPTGLEGPELIAHLQARKVAQGKLRDYYNEQIQFLDQGGTVAGFLRRKEESTKQSDDQGERLSDADLLNKYGG